MALRATHGWEKLTRTARLCPLYMQCDDEAHSHTTAVSTLLCGLKLLNSLCLSSPVLRLRERPGDTPGLKLDFLVPDNTGPLPLKSHSMKEARFLSDSHSKVIPGVLRLSVRASTGAFHYPREGFAQIHEEAHGDVNGKTRCVATENSRTQSETEAVI